MLIFVVIITKQFTDVYVFRFNVDVIYITLRLVTPGILSYGFSVDSVLRSEDCFTNGVTGYMKPIALDKNIEATD